MGDHEAWTMIDVDSNVLYDQLTDLEHLPELLPWMTDVHLTSARPDAAQGLEVRLPHQPVHEEVEVDGDQVGHQEGWIDMINEDRILRWGAAGPHEYRGELLVDFVADGMSKLTVRLHTTQDGDVGTELEQALAGVKSTLEQQTEAPPAEPGA